MLQVRAPEYTRQYATDVSFMPISAQAAICLLEITLDLIQRKVHHAFCVTGSINFFINSEDNLSHCLCRNILIILDLILLELYWIYLMVLQYNASFSILLCVLILVVVM